jgi:C4-dicarboxylate transporter DctM subunit
MDAYVTELLFGGFLLLLVLGAPITVALGAAGMAAYLVLDKDPIALVQIAFNSVGSFPLMALPAFVLAGALMEAAGISRRLVDIAETLAGPITGGVGRGHGAGLPVLRRDLGLGAGDDRGRGHADDPRNGAPQLRPRLRVRHHRLVRRTRHHHPAVDPDGDLRHRRARHGATARGRGQVGNFASLSIPKLFVAGVVPGLVMAGALLVMNHVVSRRAGYRGLSERWDAGAVGAALRRGVWAIAAPIIILGGIYTGLFTPTESAIVAIFYTLFVGFAVHRELRWGTMLAALRTTTWITGRVLLILFTAVAFGRLLVEQRIPAQIAESMLALTDNIYLIWTLVIAFLLFVGMFMETLAAILILTPVLLPIMYTMGADPTHVGIVVICAMSIGFMTPPLGENLFVASGIGGEPVERIIVRVLPFVAVSVVAVFLIAFFPRLSLAVPKMLGY